MAPKIRTIWKGASRNALQKRIGKSHRIIYDFRTPQTMRSELEHQRQLDFHVFTKLPKVTNMTPKTLHFDSFGPPKSPKRQPKEASEKHLQKQCLKRANMSPNGPPKGASFWVKMRLGLRCHCCPWASLFYNKLDFSSNFTQIFHKGVSISRTQELQEMHAQTQEPWRGGASGLPARYKNTMNISNISGTYLKNPL